MAATGRGMDDRLRDDGAAAAVFVADEGVPSFVDEAAASAAATALEELERWKHRSDMTGCCCCSCSWSMVSLVEEMAAATIVVVLVRLW